MARRRIVFVVAIVRRRRDARLFCGGRKVVGVFWPLKIYKAKFGSKPKASKCWTCFGERGITMPSSQGFEDGCSYV